MLIISIAFIITLCVCSKREHTNPLDPSNPNSDAILIPPPTGLKATPDHGAIDLTWDIVTDAVGYKVFRDDEQVTTISSAFYDDVGLTPDKKYKYQVASVHSSGLGGHKSVPVYATPLGGAGIRFSKYEVISDNNNDGIVNRGEVVKVRVYLKNVGTSRAYQVNARLTTTDPYTTIDSNYANYADLDAGWEHYGESYWDSDWSYKFTISDSCPSGHIVVFDLDIKDDHSNSWSDSFTVPVQ